jgi:predicted nucleic acid-binding protein
MALTYFFDSSAILKAYIYEPGSDWVNVLVRQRNPAPRIYVAELARVEVVSMLYRIERENHIDVALTTWTRNRFEHDLRIQRDYRGSRYLVVRLETNILGRATALLESYRSGTPHALRSLDSIQLASALTARDSMALTERREMQFVTLDEQLLGCAAAEVFPIVSPLSPPAP